MHNGNRIRPDAGHSFSSQPDLVLPTQSVQNQIHELAKTLPPPRKQNTACDACRSRKVKCNRIAGQDKCQHCLSKNYPCTHYVQQATSEKKRATAARRPRNLSVTASPSLSSVSSHSSPVDNGSPPYAKANFNFSWGNLRPGAIPGVSMNTTSAQLLVYLFSPPDSPSEPGNIYSAVKSRPALYADWGDEAPKLDDETFRAEFALDLVEVYFQIVHTRIPLLNPLQFRNRLNLVSKSFVPFRTDPLHPALVATVLAWGAKFSEHPLLVADRSRNGGQSRIAKALLDRVRELAEALKVHRIPHNDHVVISLLIEPLQCQKPDKEPGFHGFWLTSGIRNLLGLQINHKSVMATIQDPEARGTMIFAWWMACLCDAFSAFYYRRKPILDEDDYDIDFYTADPNSPDDGAPSPREQLEFLGYYRAAHDLARISRRIARLLCRPSTEEGLPLEDLVRTMDDLDEWRKRHLRKVGVPQQQESRWDFVTAVSACASDAQYHVMWTGLFFAVDEVGIRDRDNSLSPSEMNHIETKKRKLYSEGLDAALRIAGLAGVLTQNGYLKLDPAVMHVSIIQAGQLLAKSARPEVSACIDALEQYSYAYEEALEYAQEIRKTYEHTSVHGPEFAEMASAVHALRVPAGGAGTDDMNVDQVAMRHSPNGSLQDVSR